MMTDEKFPRTSNSAPSRRKLAQQSQIPASRPPAGKPSQRLGLFHSTLVVGSVLATLLGAGLLARKDGLAADAAGSVTVESDAAAGVGRIQLAPLPTVVAPEVKLVRPLSAADLGALPQVMVPTTPANLMPPVANQAASQFELVPIPQLLIPQFAPLARSQSSR